MFINTYRILIKNPPDYTEHDLGIAFETFSKAHDYLEKVLFSPEGDKYNFSRIVERQVWRD